MLLSNTVKKQPVSAEATEQSPHVTTTAIFVSNPMHCHLSAIKHRAVIIKQPCQVRVILGLLRQAGIVGSHGIVGQ